MDPILECCKGVTEIVGEVNVCGFTEGKHDTRLHHMMEITLEHGLILNKDKCAVGASSRVFFGMYL